MRKHVLMTFALLPMLLTVTQAEQHWTADSSRPLAVWSEDSDKSSYLGVDIADITTERLSTLKLKEEHGVEVTMVDQDAPAGKAGIKEHDVILTMNGTVIESKSQLQRMIHETPAGRLVTFGLSRDGQPMTIKVQLADRHKELTIMKDGDWSKNFRVEIPPIPPINIPPINIPEIDIPNIGVVYVQSSMRSGLMVENLTPQLGEFFGAKNGSGVLVRSVEKGSRGEKAGLRAGDIIHRVGDQPVHDTSDFAHAMRGHDGGSVGLGVLRDKKETTLTITLPERKDSGDLFEEEESMEAPEVEAETLLELCRAREEVAKLHPQMELARQESLRATEELREALCNRQKQLKDGTEKLMELAPKAREKAMEQLEKGRDKMQKEMEELRLQLKSYGLDI
jgi:serine protease Do